MEWRLAKKFRHRTDTLLPASVASCATEKRALAAGMVCTVEQLTQDPWPDGELLKIIHTHIAMLLST
jgi:hypothetical protein